MSTTKVPQLSLSSTTGHTVLNTWEGILVRNVGIWLGLNDVGSAKNKQISSPESMESNLWTTCITKEPMLMLLKRDDDDDDDFARNPSSPLSVLCVLSPMSWIWKSLIGIPAKITNSNSWTSVPFEYLIDIIILPVTIQQRLTGNRPRTSSWAQTLTNSFASAFDLWELISGYSAVDNELYPHHHLTYKSIGADEIPSRRSYFLAYINSVIKCVCPRI